MAHYIGSGISGLQVCCSLLITGKAEDKVKIKRKGKIIRIEYSVQVRLVHMRINNIIEPSPIVCVSFQSGAAAERPGKRNHSQGVSWQEASKS